MVRKVIIIAIACILIQDVYAQRLVDHSKAEILAYMKTEKPTFALDNSSVNTTFKYLKYVDKTNEETLFCFLSDKDVCTMTRLLGDYESLDEKIRSLDNDCSRTGKDQWTYTEKGQRYTLKLKRDKWYYILETTREK